MLKRRVGALSSPSPSANLAGRFGCVTGPILKGYFRLLHQCTVGRWASVCSFRNCSDASFGAPLHQATKRSRVIRDPTSRVVFYVIVVDSSGSLGRAEILARAAQVVVVSSVMFTFISFWRTAAIVLCDMSSTVYYVGAIVENAIGKAAPWFILAVLLFSYAMRAVYIESCALFVRGGVYRIVKEALGGFWAKAAVSALLFDYVLTGPISGVSAGQYIVGLVLETLHAHRRLARSTNRRAHAHQELGLRRHRLRRHALLPAAEPARHPRIERQGAARS